MKRSTGLLVVVCLLFAGCGGDGAADDKTNPAAGITVQAGIDDYMEQFGSYCVVVIRNADDPAAAVRGLRKFDADLYQSDLFAALDGEFGPEVDGGLVRYTPSLSDVGTTPDGPSLTVDLDDVLDTWPELIPSIIQQLRERLHESGVRRAQIGFVEWHKGKPVPSLTR